MNIDIVLFLFASCFAVPIGVLLASQFPRLRDVVFFMMVFSLTAAMLFPQFDINFLGREWYRGTSRGIQITFVDLLMLILFFSVVLTRGQYVHTGAGNPQAAAILTQANRRFYVPASFWLMSAYVLYACVNVAISEPKIFGVWELAKLFRGLILFLAVAWYIRGERELRLFLIALCVSIAFVSLNALYSRYGVGVHRVRAPFDHPNILSMYSVIAAPFFVAAAATANLPKWLRGLSGFCALLAVGCVILSISRTGFATIVLVAGGTVVVVAGLRLTPGKLVFLFAAIIIGAAMIFQSWDSLVGRYLSASLEDEYGQEDRGRGMYFRLAWNMVQDHPEGVGLNNWSYHVSNHYAATIGREQAAYPGVNIPPLDDGAIKTAVPAHNLGALTIGELGWPGFFLMIAMWVRWFQVTGVFLFERADVWAARFGVAAFFSLAGLFLHNVTEYEFRGTMVYFQFNIIMGASAGLYYLRSVARQAAANGA